MKRQIKKVGKTGIQYKREGCEGDKDKVNKRCWSNLVRAERKETGREVTEKKLTIRKIQIW